MKGKPPYGSDFYLNILADCGKNIRLQSDDKLSKDGFNIWKKLYALGHTVAIYDKNKPGKTFVKFLTLADIESYFKKDKNYRNYNFVLCESKNELGNLTGIFGIRKIREETPLGTDD